MQLACLLVLNARRCRLDQRHIGLELLQIKQRPETELPQDGQNVYGEEVAVHLWRYSLEHIMGSHLVDNQ
jgi:hypothetical protein